MNPQLRTTLEVELLESRLVPDARAYIAGLYTTVLQRAGNDTEINSWVFNLNRRMPAATIAQAFINSRERHVLDVNRAYLEILRRNADVGSIGFVNLMDNGASTVDVRIQLLTSFEYRLTHGDNISFVRGLYQDLLRRTPSDFEVVGWVARLNAGVSREAIAAAFLDSNERLSPAIDLLYFTYLGRLESAAERNSFLVAAHYVAGAVERIEVSFAASPEFASRFSYIFLI